MSKRALVVDNDFFFVEFLRERLEQRGYEVVKAYDGKEGISRLADTSPDIFFVDLIMPKIDGKQLIEFTRSKYPQTDFPIIAVSGAIIEQKESLHEIEADYFFQKGPLEAMTEQFDLLMDKIEKQPPGSSVDKELFEPGRLFTRQETGELIELLNFQRAVTESIGVGVLVLDTDAKIIQVNSSGLDILDSSIDKVLNQPVTRILAREERAGLGDVLKRVSQEPEGRKTTLSATINSKDVVLVVSPLRLGEGEKVSGFVISLEETEGSPG